MRSSIPLSYHCQNNPSKKKSDQAIPMLIVYLRAFNSATIYPSSGICFRLSPRPPSPPHSQDLSISSATVQAVHAAQSPSIPSHTLLRWKNSYCRLCSNDPLHRAFPDTAGRNLLFFFSVFLYNCIYLSTSVAHTIWYPVSHTTVSSVEFHTFQDHFASSFHF